MNNSSLPIDKKCSRHAEVHMQVATSKSHCTVGH
jgi:hypothetical protein